MIKEKGSNSLLSLRANPGLQEHHFSHFLTMETDMPIRTKAEAIGKLDEAKSLIARVEEQLAIGARSPAQFTFLQDAPENDFLPRALSQIKEVRDYLDAEERRGGIRQGPDLIV